MEVKIYDEEELRELAKELTPVFAAIGKCCGSRKVSDVFNDETLKEFCRALKATKH